MQSILSNEWRNFLLQIVNSAQSLSFLSDTLTLKGLEIIIIIFVWSRFNGRNFWNALNSNQAQEKNSCSLVLKLKVWDRCISKYLQGHYNTVYHESSAPFLKCTRHFFQREASSESNCNSSFRGQPSGSNRRLFLPLHSTRVLPLNSRILFEIAIPQYPLL